MDDFERAMLIEQRIADAFAHQGTTVFWAEQFAADGLGTGDEVISAIARLVKYERKLDAVIEIMSPEGHPCWQGTPERFEQDKHKICGDLDCGTPYSAGHIVVHYVLSNTWKRVLGDQKKVLSQSPRCHLSSSTFTTRPAVSRTWCV